MILAVKSVCRTQERHFIHKSEVKYVTEHGPTYPAPATRSAFLKRPPITELLRSFADRDRYRFGTAELKFLLRFLIRKRFRRKTGKIGGAIRGAFT